ncbi:MAG: hypothetical protein J6S13_07785 [Clostridia bacterium]|nr:hypothetical protein [Clostridia bacterium]
MAAVLPGTEIEASKLKKRVFKSLESGIFAAGGIALSQVSVIMIIECREID